MSIGGWRRMLVIEALRQLVYGEPVTPVAGALGYPTLSAFSTPSVGSWASHPGATSARLDRGVPNGRLGPYRSRPGRGIVEAPVRRKTAMDNR
ncbi:MAG TPA: hypothetical protein VNH82_07705 [Candidatus Dormibacteraeota bacterium]|nr:hypothetical protein [Candidatus Dormibacteraeota bacterium]